ncbi:MAG: glycosyltransferase [Desulfovibrio sp.]|jgi:glycosyltransferase involved in cell wall biosynthesis|nr:glycosyltransferase [Desulfovibrio sp.]
MIFMHSFGGGAEGMALYLARLLSVRHFQIRLACVRHIPALLRCLPDGVSLTMPEQPGIWPALRNMWRIWRLARRYDTVLGGLELQSIFWAAMLAPGRAVAWLHKDISGYIAQKSTGYAWLYAALLGWALRRCRSVACVSRGILESSARLWPDLSPRLYVLYYPVNIGYIRKRAASPLPEILRPCFDRPVILGVGRLEEQKAFHLLLRAQRLLRERGLDCHCCILGEGSQRARLEGDIRRLGLEGRAFLPGFMDPFPAMARASVLALSSLFEGFSLVIAEALCLGLPVVSADCPSGPAELLDGGKYGVLTPIGGVDALADAIENILQKGIDDGMRTAGMARAKEFSPKRTLAAWTSFLLKCCHNG